MGTDEQVVGNTVSVDIQDLAQFAGDVNSSRVFNAVTGHWMLKNIGEKYQILVSPRHWMCVRETAWTDDPTREMRRAIKSIERRILSIDHTLEGAASMRACLES